jgi:hypothetical protein
MIMKYRFIKRFLLLATLSVCWQINPLAMEVEQEEQMRQLGKSMEPHLLSIFDKPGLQGLCSASISSASIKKYMAHFIPDPEELIKSALNCLEIYPIRPLSLELSITTSFIMKRQPLIFVTEVMPVHYPLKEQEPIGLLPPKQRVCDFEDHPYVELYKSPRFNRLAISNLEEMQKQQDKFSDQFALHTVETVQNFIRSGNDIEKRQNLIIRLLNGERNFAVDDKVLLIRGLYGLLDSTSFVNDDLNRKYGKKKWGNILHKSIVYPPLRSDDLVNSFPSEIMGIIISYAAEEDQIAFALTCKSLLMYVAELKKPLLLNHIAEEIIKNYLQRGWVFLDSNDHTLKAASKVRMNRMDVKVPFLN